MHQATAENVTIKNRGGYVRAKMIRLPSSDLLQTVPAILTTGNVRPKTLEIPAGTFWRPNRELERETEGGTSHARYGDIYDLLRAGHHVVHRYGADEPRKGSETSEIREDVATARTFVRFLLAMRMYEPDEKLGLYRIHAELVRRYGPKRNEHKMTARERFMRGIVMTDRLGRHNPPAAAMVEGSGIGHLLQRLDDVRWISSAIDRRTVHVWGSVEEHLDLYHEQWQALSPGVNGRGRGDILRMVAASPDRHTVSALDRLLREFRDAFAAVTANPYRRNAEHTRDDLEEAILLCREWKTARLLDVLARVRRGIRWVFALHALQTEVIAPFSYLRDELDRERRRGNKGKRLLDVPRDSAPERFAATEAALEDFLRRLDKCSDERLVRPVKAEVERLASFAREAMRKDSWLEGKKFLLQAAKLL